MPGRVGRPSRRSSSIMADLTGRSVAAPRVAWGSELDKRPPMPASASSVATRGQGLSLEGAVAPLLAGWHRPQPLAAIRAAKARRDFHGIRVRERDVVHRPDGCGYLVWLKFCVRR